MSRHLFALPALVGAMAIAIPSPTAAVEVLPTEPAGCDFDGDGFADLAIGVDNDWSGSGDHEGAVHVLYGDDSGLSSEGSQQWDRDQPGVLGVSRFSARFGAALSCGDFDDDGYDDLAVGVPWDDPTAITNVVHTSQSGSVHILYGTAAGLSADRNQIWHRDTDGINQAAAEFDHFGSSVATGDFDGDGYDDLAVGVPGDDLAGRLDAGSVHIVYGTAAGLSADRDQVWHRDRGGINDSPAARDAFGSSLAVGDFDGDGDDDLAVGVPHDRIGDQGSAGSVHIIYGTPDGLARFGDQIWHRARGFIDGTARSGDSFGSSLATADFDGDGDDDLAVGVPLDNMRGIADAGSVQIIYGGAVGLSPAGDQVWHRERSDIAEPNDDGKFGWSVASGDFDHDGVDDVVIGVPAVVATAAENEGSAERAGSIHVLYGSVAGLSAAGNEVLHLGTAGAVGEPIFADQFGWSVGCSDFDGDGAADVAIGIPSKNLDTTRDAGAVSVFHGGVDGLTTAGSQLWTRESPGIGGTAGKDQRFGFTLA